MFRDDDSAQVSAELLIVIAAVLAVAVILVTQMQATAKKGGDLVANKADKAFDEVAAIK